MFKKLLHSKSVQRRAAWILIIVLVPPFILFFHTWMGGRPIAGETAGIIFGRPIPVSDFQEEYARLRQRVEEEIGPVPAALEPVLRDQTWDRFILQTEAKRRVKVSNQELAEFIRTQPAFQREGRFVPELYHQFVAARGMTPSFFEARLRDELGITKLADSVTTTVTVTDEEAHDAFVKARTKIRAELVVVRADSFTDEAKRALTEEALRRAYEANPDAFRPAATEEDAPTAPRRFEDARADVERALIEEHTMAAARDRARQLREALQAKHSAGASWEEACAALSVKPLRPSPFTRAEPIEGLGDAPLAGSVLAALPPQELSEVLPVPQGALVGWVIERLPTEEAAWEHERESFRTDALTRKRQEHFREWLGELRRRAHLKNLLPASPLPAAQ